MKSTQTPGIIGALRSLALAFALCTALAAAVEVAPPAPPASPAKPALSQTSGGQPTNAAQALKVNINKASAEELTKLPRIGPKIAERILAFRKEHGDFKKAEELMNVKGIGQKTFERLKAQIAL